MSGKIVLAVSALMFLGFGIAFLLAPAELGALVQLKADNPVARTELRAFYGGMEIGLALFQMCCVFKAAWTAPGLLVAGLAFGCTAGARIFGLIVDQSTNNTMLMILVVEVIFAVAAFVALAKTRPQEKVASVKS